MSCKTPRLCGTGATAPSPRPIECRCRTSGAPQRLRRIGRPRRLMLARLGATCCRLANSTVARNSISSSTASSFASAIAGRSAWSSPASRRIDASAGVPSSRSPLMWPARRVGCGPETAPPGARRARPAPPVPPARCSTRRGPGAATPAEPVCGAWRCAAKPVPPLRSGATRRPCVGRVLGLVWATFIHFGPLQCAVLGIRSAETASTLVGPALSSVQSLRLTSRKSGPLATTTGPRRSASAAPAGRICRCCLQALPAATRGVLVLPTITPARQPVTASRPGLARCSQGSARRSVHGVPASARSSAGAIVEREVEFALDQLASVRVACATPIHHRPADRAGDQRSS
jgi:hypothetical protein